MTTTQGTQKTGTVEEEDVTICQGTSEEEAEEGVGEWKPGIAERAWAGQLGAPLCSGGRAHGVRRPTRTLLSFSLLFCASVSLLFSQ